jgi:NAD(P)-dependent dehydrogenase (short-subunit alcohol dehydrogenase family)
MADVRLADEPWEFANRCFVITGASSGMGAETARFLGARHARLVLQGRDTGRLAAVAADILAAGGQAVPVTLDLEEALSRTLAIELAPLGIRVNTIAPGFVRTPMLQPILDATPRYEEQLFEQTPAGRIGRPEEIAATVAFLLSGMAPYINGVSLPADGGWLAR